MTDAVEQQAAFSRECARRRRQGRRREESHRHRWCRKCAISSA
ncbi:MAG: hypothetical protein ACLTDR_07470 [Adlercreutzia equolifaciens]